MREFIQRLQAQIAENPPNYGDYDAMSIIEMLYHTYTENNPPYNQLIRDGFQELNDLLEGMTLDENNSVFHVVSGLCMEHSWLSFEAGLKVGLLLSDELAERKGTG